MTTAAHHHIEINCEPPSRSGALVLNGGHRAGCSCGWWSDCYEQLSDTQHAIEVHLRRAPRKDFEGLIARASIDASVADIKERGIDAHLVDLERELTPPWRRKKAKTKTERAQR